MSAATLLDRLDRVRQMGPGRWLARCPAHEDRSPSLSIRELDDGRVLLHDFGGCDTEAVLSALGLALSDLFPPRVPGSPNYTPTHSRIPARDLLAVISEDVTTIAMIAATMLETGSITPEQWPALVQAVQRVNRARDHIHV